MLKTGQVFNNRYKIISTLGEGGFGAVYKVWDDNLQRFCAIKENLQVSAESQKQFKREAIMLANLNHPHLVRVTDYFIVSDQGQYLVMDFVDGIDLQTALINYGKALPFADTMRWTLQICDALIYIHSQNPPIIHRDVKPANIRITPQNNAVLVDFGLAKVFEENAKTSMGARGLTPHFASPEQYGMGGTDAQSDIYSLGVTLYCMLTNHIPADSVDIMVGNAELPPPAKAINKDVPEHVSDALQHAMQIRRTDRYRSASDFKNALGASQSFPPQNKASLVPAEKPQKQSGADFYVQNANQWYMKGKQLCDLEDYEEAISCFENALGLEPQYAYVWREKGFCEENLGLTLDAIHSYKRVLEFADEEFGLIQSAIARLDELERDANPSVSQKPQTDRKIINQPADVTYANKLTLSNGMEFMRVPAGKFLIGSNDGEDEEEPLHTVDIAYDYWMACFPVTNELYNSYVKAKGVKHPINEWENKKDHPVGGVSWADATEYCQWLNNLIKSEIPLGLVLRLPTEEEWEKAARGADGREYPWGNTFDKNKCNSVDEEEDRTKSKTTSVGLYSPRGDSPYGCADMAGNVWEWVNDWHSKTYYRKLPSSNPLGPSSVIQVLRGGSCYDTDYGVRSTFRLGCDPLDASGNFGFRVLLSPIEDKGPAVETPKPVQAVTPTSNKLTLSNGMEFMRVPAGKFIMGSNNGADNEKPQHTVYIPYDYWMARFPITNEQYNLYVKAKRIEHPVFNWEIKKNHPVVSVAWNDVMLYCRWLNNLFKAELPSGLVLRLPSEAEWEKAARGTDGRVYPWGDVFDPEKANTEESKLNNTTSVGKFSPQGDSAYSCADMAGNVWEWTHSLREDYPYKINDGREDENTPNSRILRGGSFSYQSARVRCRCAHRYAADPDSIPPFFGFRVIASPSFQS